MGPRKFSPKLAVAVLAGALAIAALTGAAPSTASPAVRNAAAAAADQVSPLCELEGGQALAVDTGQGRQFPNDPLVYPWIMAGDTARITVIPCWTNDSPPADDWITSVTAHLGDDSAPVGQADGLHTVDPFTLLLNGSGSVPPAPTIEPLTIQATDKRGVEQWSATIMVQLLTPCADDPLVGIDSGAAHDGADVEVESDAARVTLIPCSPDTTITAVTAYVFGGAQIDDQHPVAEVTGLNATAPFTLDLHDNDGTAFAPGESQLYLDVTDDHGDVQTVRRTLWVTSPITASWSVGTTLPDTPTTVRASFDNETGSPIRSVTFTLYNSGIGDPLPAELSDDLSSAESAMTFEPWINEIRPLVTLANGITYPLAGHYVDARYIVDTSVAAPTSTTWGEETTFHAKAVSSTGIAQRGLTLHLQSRVPGSTRWVERAAAKTNARGAATLSLPAADTGTAAWRVTSTANKRRHRSTSRTRLVPVHATFGRLPAKRSVRIGHTIRYKVAVRPASARARVDVQVQRVGRSAWATLGHATSRPDETTIPVRPTRAGSYKVRLVVHATSVLARTVSRDWNLLVKR
jgi:hypothetical protein